MNPKLLLVLSWIFYLIVRRTNDEIWLFCLILGCILTVCAFFYRQEKKLEAGEKKVRVSS
jgi:hypothetical protein